MQNFKRFQSPTYGPLSLTEVLGKIEEFMSKAPQDKYRVVIGTDSQTKNRAGADYVTAVIVHRVGSGGIYFWHRTKDARSFGLRDRIYKEATLSLQCAQKFLELFQKRIGKTFDLEIHVDIGRVGETRAMIAEVVGMIRASGFEVKVKPEAYGASTVADRYA